MNAYGDAWVLPHLQPLLAVHPPCKLSQSWVMFRPAVGRGLQFAVVSSGDEGLDCMSVV